MCDYGTKVKFSLIFHIAGNVVSRICGNLVCMNVVA